MFDYPIMGWGRGGGDKLDLCNNRFTQTILHSLGTDKLICTDNKSRYYDRHKKEIDEMIEELCTDSDDFENNKRFKIEGINKATPYLGTTKSRNALGWQIYIFVALDLIDSFQKHEKNESNA